MKTLFVTLALLSAVPATAQVAPALAPPRTDAPRTILFVGNSFTQGAHSAVRNWRADTVTDLNNAGYGGVPALFKRFTEEVGQRWNVSLETQGGKSLGFHYDERRALFDRAWDVVVLQEFSTLDRDRPGDATSYIADVGRLLPMLRARNPRVDVQLMATWSRADLAYRGRSGPWKDRPIATMAEDLRVAADRARAAVPGVAGVLPVGQAWNRAFAAGVADPDPYDGTTFGQMDFWAYDQYHASTYGYYLEALVVFGRITGIDPRTLGKDETAADELGLSDLQAVALQRIAAEQLAAEPDNAHR